MMHSPHYNLINIISLTKKAVGNIVENVCVSVKPVIYPHGIWHEI